MDRREGEKPSRQRRLFRVRLAGKPRVAQPPQRDTDKRAGRERQQEARSRTEQRSFRCIMEGSIPNEGWRERRGHPPTQYNLI